MNIVRCKVKTSARDEYLNKVKQMQKFEGQLSAKYIETKPNEFFMVGEWNSEDDIAKARPKMISFLDSEYVTVNYHSLSMNNKMNHSYLVYYNLFF